MENKKIATPGSEHTFTVHEQEEGIRLDLFLTQHFPDYSRNFFQTLIEQKKITINNGPVQKSGHRLKKNDIVLCVFPAVAQRSSLLTHEAESLDVKIVFEHTDFLIINKPAGLLTHKPHQHSTDRDLVDWLLHHYQTIEHVGYSERPGIVHRLDKDTSGLLIVALTPQGHNTFAQLFKNRLLKKEYLLLVQGHPEQKGVIDFPLGRHPALRTKVAHVATGRSARTDFEVIEYFEKTSLVKADLITGRTHQIRVHFATLGYPLIGDTVYGTASPAITRQALHAYHLAFEYQGKPYSFTQKPPADFQKVLDLQKKLQ